MRKQGDGYVIRSEESITLDDVLPSPLTTPADPSRSLRITPFLSCHYDALPYPVILSGGKNALWEKQGDGYVIRSEESIILMTPYRFPHYDVLPSAVILTNILYIKLFFYNISTSW